MGKRKEKVLYIGDVLDKCAMERFPGVVVETGLDMISMNRVTKWRDADGNKLKPTLARQVREFVAGFSAGWYMQNPK